MSIPFLLNAWTIGAQFASAKLSIAGAPYRDVRPKVHRPDPVRLRAKNRQQRIRFVCTPARFRAGRSRHRQAGPRRGLSSSAQDLVSQRPRSGNRRSCGCMRYVAWQLRWLPTLEPKHRDRATHASALRQLGFVSPVDNTQRLEFLRLRPLGDHVHQRADTTGTVKTDATVEQGAVHTLDALDRGAIGRQAINVAVAQDL